jgi:hypothetical protein
MLFILVKIPGGLADNICRKILTEENKCTVF